VPGFTRLVLAAPDNHEVLHQVGGDALFVDSTEEHIGRLPDQRLQSGRQRAVRISAQKKRLAEYQLEWIEKVVMERQLPIRHSPGNLKAPRRLVDVQQHSTDEREGKHFP